MKSTLANINSIYKPKRKKKSLLRVNKKDPEIIKPDSHLDVSISKLKASQIPTDPSLRSLSVLKNREEMIHMRNESRSVEPPWLPTIKSRSPEPFSPRQNKTLFSTASSFDSDIQKLEILVNRNNSARNNLLTVQQQIMELGIKQIMNQKFQSIDEKLENCIIDEEEPNFLQNPKRIRFVSNKKDLFQVKRTVKLPPIC